MLKDTVYVEGKRFVMSCHPSVTHRLLSLPGSSKRNNGYVTMPLNLISWHLLKSIDFLLFGASANDWYSEERRLIDLGREVNFLTREHWDQPDLWEWQSQALARLSEGSVALFDDRGMGKTRTVVEAIRASQRDSERSAVVVTSKRLRNVWQAAIERWWAEERVCLPSALTWSAAADQVGSATVTVVTYESLMNQDVHNAIAQLDPHWLILEEAHNLKKRDRYNERVKDGKLIKTDTKSGLVRALPGRVRIAVSGTPMPNVWYESWTLLNFVAPDVFTSFWQFVEGLGEVTVNFWGGKEIGIDIQEQAMWDDIFDRWIILRDRSKSRRTIWDFVPINLSEKELRAYRQMQDNMVAEKPSGEVLDAPNVLAQAVRLQQLAGGLGTWETYYDESGKKKSSYKHADPSSKLDELLFRLEGLRRSVVFTRFRDRANFVADAIRSNLGYEVMLMVGGLSEANQKKMLDRFFSNAPEDIVAVCVYGTISEGVNELVSARDIFILDWLTAKDVAQAVDRLDRPGTMHDSVRATVLYSEGTIDELMIDRSSMRVLPLKEILRTPDAWEYLANPIDRRK